MKTIGLIGGMSWESTVTYYKTINTLIKERLGGFHSSNCILYSVDFHEIESCQLTGDWGKASAILSDVAKRLETAGADFIVICTNTMHKVAEKISETISIPLLHIADATAQEIKANNLSKVALLGTQYTMEQDFYKSKLIANGLTVMVPDKDDRLTINRVIYTELCLGIVSEESKIAFLDILNKLATLGAQGIILGCTEIGLLLHQENTPIPLFDTAFIHAREAALLSIQS